MLRGKKFNRNKAIVGVFVVAAVVGGVYLFNDHRDTSSTKELTISDIAQGIDVKSIEETFDKVVEVENSTPVKFDEVRGIANFQTKLEGDDITITQQPLLETFKDNDEAIKGLAVSLNGQVRTSAIVAGEASGYLVDFSSGRQTLILAIDDLLIFANSDTNHDTLVWVSFVNKLQAGL